jgi:hypothetical protein
MHNELQPHKNGMGVNVECAARHCRGDSVHYSCCKLTDAGFCDSACSSNNVVQPQARHDVHSLFLISKQVNQGAVSVFFGRSRFTVVPPGLLQSTRGSSQYRYPRLIGLPMHRLELPLFLSSLEPNALQHIR